MEQKVLIVGVDSLIGSEFLSYCQLHNIPHIATSKRRETISETCTFLDLTDSPEKWQLPDGINQAVICAGISTLTACEQNPEESARINVDGTLNMIDYFHKKEIKPIYLSTNQVFDGTSPYKSLEDSHNPVSVYGTQKSKIEKRLMADMTNAVILRITKIILPKKNILKEWIKTLKQNKEITPFKNMVMAPVHIEQVIHALAKVVTDQYNGIFHLSGSEDVSYADVAHLLTKKLGLSSENVIPINADQQTLPKGALPEYTTLDATHTVSRLGIKFKTIEQILDQVIREKQNAN